MSKTPEEMALKAFTIDDIRSWKPCYEPNRHLSEGWAGTAIDILKHELIPSQDKLWVVCKEEVLNARTLRLFAVWCARQVQHLMTDARSITALDVAERFANGDATQAELAAARAAARGAAKAAAWAAACNAAWDAAGAAARDAAWDAVRAAARDAAWDAARDAVRAAARGAARGAAKAAAWDAAGDAQVAQLLKMLEDK